MRTLRILAFVSVAWLTALGCVSTASPPTTLTLKAQPTAAVEVDPERLRTHVTALIGTSRPRNSQNPLALDQAAGYISREFAAAGYAIYEQRYQVEGQPYKNIIARFGPVTAPRIVVGAHYDVAGQGPGADDNASGVAGLIELARLVSQQKPALGYCVEFVAYTLEEPPHFGKPTMGSAVHAKSLKQEAARVRLMISLEMIGYYSDAPNSQQLPPSFLRSGSFSSTGNFIAVVGRKGATDPIGLVAQAMRLGSDIPVEAVLSSLLMGAGLSDQLNYWNEGYSAVMITDTAFYRNANYHKTTDLPDTLHYPKMAETVEGLYYVLLSL
ncbi:MAG: M28 family peptidase [FCB group bacterium]|jgi:Zn-dependent M28 family amino/carboxypeptidase|nr:M28 family peptidase [FCB group bacterium]